MQARRRRAWADGWARTQAEAAWFARQLVPELREASTSPERLAGAWQVGGANRVRALEDELTALVASTPDDRRRADAVSLRDAVRTGRERIDALTAVGSTSAEEAAGKHLAAALDAVAGLVESALSTTNPGASHPDDRPR